MEVKVQLFGRVYSICIGRQTKWFGQLYLLTICEEKYGNDMNICWAKMIFGFWRKEVKP